MPVSFSDLQLAFEFVSGGGMGENEAYLDRQSGKIYWHSEFGENDEELPDDIDNEKYIAIPDRRELDLGKPLILEFACEFLPDDYDEVQFEALFKKTDLDTDLWVVAWDGDAIAGVIQNWIWTDENERLGVKRGWLEKISVRRRWRRRGLARAMTAESFRRLRAAGMTDAMLGVDTENPTGALGLYESFGFRPTRRWAFYRKAF